MATASVDFELDMPAPAAWRLIGDFGSPARIAPTFVRSCQVEGNERVVTFQSGATARERLVTLEAETCRICYSVVGGRFEHHNASMQVLPSGSGKSVVRWTTDLLPNHLAPMVQAMMEEGARAIVAEQQRQGTSHSPAPERSGAR